MTTVLETGITLNPANQIAELADDTGLVVNTQYIVAGTYFTYDTRFTFQGNLDIVLTKPPVGVPAAGTIATVAITTIPVPAVAVPPAVYPYTTKNQLTAPGLNHDLEFNPGATPPSSPLGGAGMYKYWVDTSTTPATLRQCVVARASAAYVPAEWISVATIDGTNGFVVTNAVKKTGDTMSGALNITASGTSLTTTGGVAVGGNITVAALTASGAMSAANLTTSGNIQCNGALVVVAGASTGSLTVNGVLGVTSTAQVNGALNCYGGVNINAGGLTIGSGGANIGGGVTVGALTNNGNEVVNGQLIVGSGATFNAGGTAIAANNGNIVCGGQFQGGSLAISGAAQITGGGGLTVSASLAVGNQLTVGSTATFSGDVAIHGSSLVVDHGNMSCAGTLTVSSGTALQNTSCTQLYASSQVTTPIVNGGPANAGLLQMYGTNENICFQWASGQAGGINGGVVNAIIDAGVIQQIVNTNSGGPVAQIYYQAAGPTGYGIAFISNNDTEFFLYADTFSSDARIKEKIADSKIDALAAILAIPVRQFDFPKEVVRHYASKRGDEDERKAAMKAAKAHHVPIGLVAQEVLPHVPGAVVARPRPADGPLPDSMLMIHHDEFVPYLIKAVQQLSAELAELKLRAS
jgi:hypothetical protein